MTDADRLLREMAWYGCELLGWEPPSFDGVIYPAARRTQGGSCSGGAVTPSEHRRLSEGVTGWASLLAAATPADAPSESRCGTTEEGAGA